MKLLALFGLAACTLITSGCCNVCPEAAKAEASEFFGMARSTTSTPRHRFVEKYNGWHKRYDAKRNQLYAANKKVDMIYIGDSITHGWENRASMEVQKKFFPNLNILNLAHSGDRTEHQYWMVRDSGFLDTAQAQLVVVLIGTNNIGHKVAGVEATAAGIKLIVETIRAKQPNAKVLLFGVFPRGEKPDNAFRVQVKAINAMVAPLADNENVFFVDLADKLLEKDGSISKKIMPDFLHLTPAGYTIWAEAIKPYAERFCR